MRNLLRGILLVFFIFCTSLAVAEQSSSACDKDTPKYVFLFVGDGMGLAQLELADEYARLSGMERIFINDFDNCAVTRTSSANSFITDSAASATAFACGVKTKNGCLGVDADGGRHDSSAVAALKSGRKVGIITTVTMNHATPAGFYAHNKKRSNYYEIALDMLDSNFNYFAGEGIASADDKKSPAYRGDIYSLLEKNGYKVCQDEDSFNELKAGTDKAVVSYKSGLSIDRRGEDSGISLADVMRKAIELLDSDKGFFLMVEGGKIDFMCHINDAASALWEIFDFDKAVKVALDFMKEHKEDTLIVVTADHETGGFVLGSGDGFSPLTKIGSDKSDYSAQILNLGKQKCSQPEFAKRLAEIKKDKGQDFSFDDAKVLMEECFGMKFSSAEKPDSMSISAADEKLLKDCFDKYFKPQNENSNRFQIYVSRMMAHKAGLSFSTTGHSALPAITWAKGVGADKFYGRIENTDISKILKNLLK